MEKRLMCGGAFPFWGRDWSAGRRVGSDLRRIPRRRHPEASRFHRRCEGSRAQLLGPKGTPRQILRYACNAAPLKMTPPKCLEMSFCSGVIPKRRAFASDARDLARSCSAPRTLHARSFATPVMRLRALPCIHHDEWPAIARPVHRHHRRPATPGVSTQEQACARIHQPL